MKHFIILTILLLLCTSGLVYAGAGKKMIVKVKIEYNDKGQVIGVKNLKGDKEEAVVSEPFTGHEPIIGIPAQILLLEGDDPCVTHGGIKWCW
jgi:hypothetical protein